MSWSERTAKIQVGDKVAFSKRYCQSSGQVTGEIPFARGVVQELKAMGPEFVLATVKWDNPDIGEKVAASNLVRVTEKGILDEY
ncbi:hypothetical protein KIH39_22750 [Telmatocola sphagniphila]|uniref:Uncharacterized protein n=1 Tax=Telmatocola sphagniphila TaxID=1123043 RepID=A0A8E6B561_9BACT|nr:hypothetical protein [Telmatocola sphagniphila]QVL31634.1 hypothetical protein KIH39_22750 [Telmatocola sphagniphila]